MIQEVTFQLDDNTGEYIAHLQSPGDSVLEVVQAQAEASLISIWGNLPGMDPAYITQYGHPYSKAKIIELKMPDGVDIIVKSNVAVRAAKLMSR